MPKEDTSGHVARGKIQKPNKPYPEYPLYAHATKRWAKRIRGVIHYFGTWGDPDGAEEVPRGGGHAARGPKAA